MTVHVVVSHGADFFGQDRYDLKALHQVARYAEGCLAAAEREQLVRLLDHAGEAGHAVPAEQAAAMAGLLRRVARIHHVTSRKVAAWAAALADAAARAAAEGEPWTWTPTTN